MTKWLIILGTVAIAVLIAVLGIAGRAGNASTPLVTQQSINPPAGNEAQLGVPNTIFEVSNFHAGAQVEYYVEITNPTSKAHTIALEYSPAFTEDPVFSPLDWSLYSAGFTLDPAFITTPSVVRDWVSIADTKVKVPAFTDVRVPVTLRMPEGYRMPRLWKFYIIAYEIPDKPIKGSRVEHAAAQVWLVTMR